MINPGAYLLTILYFIILLSPRLSMMAFYLFTLSYLPGHSFRAYTCGRGTESTASCIFHDAMDVSLVFNLILLQILCNDHSVG